MSFRRTIVQSKKSRSSEVELLYSRVRYYIPPASKRLLLEKVWKSLLHFCRQVLVGHTSQCRQRPKKIVFAFFFACSFIKYLSFNCRLKCNHYIILFTLRMLTSQNDCFEILFGYTWYVVFSLKISDKQTYFHTWQKWFEYIH